MKKAVFWDVARCLIPEDGFLHTLFMLVKATFKKKTVAFLTICELTRGTYFAKP
jgi:hypothetical protein